MVEWFGIVEIAVWVLVVGMLIFAAAYIAINRMREVRMASDKYIYVPIVGGRDVCIDCSMLSYEMRTILFMYVQKPVTWLYLHAESDRFVKKTAGGKTGSYRVYREYKDYLRAFCDDMQDAVRELVRSNADKGFRNQKYVLYYGYDRAFKKDEEVLSKYMLSENEKLFAERLGIVDDYLRKIYDDMELSRRNGGVLPVNAEEDIDAAMKTPFLYMESMNRLNEKEDINRLKKHYR